MKKYSLPQINTLVLKFNLVLLVLILCCQTPSVMAQVTQSFIEELEVSDPVSIISNVPADLDCIVKGSLNTENSLDRYTISDGKGQSRLSILKELKIATWDKNIIRQETTITIDADEEITEAILTKLSINLKVNAQGEVVIDCNMNINSFSMKKRRWRNKVDCKIHFDDGSSYLVNHLEIESYLIIPKYSSIGITSTRNCTLKVGELDGDLDLALNYAEVYGTTVNNLQASLSSCYTVIFDKVDNAIISSSNSYVSIREADSVSIGTASLHDASLLSHLHLRSSNSAQSSYHFVNVRELVLNDSVNDEINANIVDRINVSNTCYTDVRIGKLKSSLDMSSRSSDLFIKLIDADFESISLQNSLSTVSLGLAQVSGFKLKIDEEAYIEGLQLPSVISKRVDGWAVYNFGGKGGEITLSCDRCKLELDSDYLK